MNAEDCALAVCQALQQQWPKTNVGTGPKSHWLCVRGAKPKDKGFIYSIARTHSNGYVVSVDTVGSYFVIRLEKP